MAQAGGSNRQKNKSWSIILYVLFVTACNVYNCIMVYAFIDLQDGNTNIINERLSHHILTLTTLGKMIIRKFCKLISSLEKLKASRRQAGFQSRCTCDIFSGQSRKLFQNDLLMYTCIQLYLTNATQSNPIQSAVPQIRTNN